MQSSDFQTVNTVMRYIRQATWPIGLCLTMAAPLFASDTVYLTKLEGAIHPISASFIIRSIEQAEAAGAGLFILEVDTPGGLMMSMDDLVKKFYASRVPIAVYVSPSGARAASAGFIIALAADVAAVAPGTHLGAAHPVLAAGEEPNEVMNTKMAEDAAASVRAIATERGRNVELAEAGVLQSKSFTADEALEGNLIDAIVPNLGALLAEAEGRSVTRPDGTAFTIHTHGDADRIIRLERNWRETVLNAIADPNIAFLLLSIGMLGIWVEFNHPGLIAPGVVGAICLLLFLMSLKALDIRVIGLALIAIAVGLFIAELKVASYGLLTVGGVICLTLGAMMMFEGPIPELRVDPWFVLPTSLTLGALIGIMTYLVIRSHRARVTTGQEGLVGEKGVSVTGLDPRGKVYLHGEYWDARAAGPIAKGSAVRVLTVEGMSLVVEAADSPGGGAGEARGQTTV